MSDTNRISAVITDEDRTIVLAAIKTIRERLNFTVSLTPDESRELARIGPRGLNFDQDCANFMRSNPELLPSFVDLKEVEKDRQAFKELSEINRDIGLLAQSTSDTLALLAHELYMADLAYYQNARQAAKRGVANAQSIFTQLSERFPGNTRAKAAVATTKE